MAKPKCGCWKNASYQFLANGEEFVLKSPGYPKRYCDMLDCFFVFRAAPGAPGFKINGSEIKLERDGDLLLTGSKVDEYGRIRYAPLTSGAVRYFSNETLRIRFMTGPAGTADGFKITITNDYQAPPTSYGMWLIIILAVCGAAFPAYFGYRHWRSEASIPFLTPIISRFRRNDERVDIVRPTINPNEYLVDVR
ncbi:unnamed protein product, partial [Mesorhabditis spiculigera]